MIDEADTPSCRRICQLAAVGSKTYGWEEEVVGLGADVGCDSVGGRFLEVSD